MAGKKDICMEEEAQLEKDSRKVVRWVVLWSAMSRMQLG